MTTQAAPDRLATAPLPAAISGGAAEGLAKKINEARAREAA
jgi:hypothetical protein